ncbi:ATP-binding protein [Rugamonas sp.]|uniref:sensor histidine kinase n=1 Tax=Rugamonas sp. TaxID=1926287 RepID=UPI0025E97CB0|nr:ATP-binding protein [Rugamonas sp.]
MAFEFKARVLLELGAELISSDAVAIYELVKNSLDADATIVRISVDIAMQYSTWQQLTDLLHGQIHLRDLSKPGDFSIEEFNNEISMHLDPSAAAPSIECFKAAYGQPKSFEEAIFNLSLAYEKSNKISVQDNGRGMSFAELKSNYLTVGTPERLKAKQDAIALTLGSTPRLQYTKTDAKLPLGEKGIGRLSAMRIGHCITVQSKGLNENNWNFLELDWRPAFNDPTLNADAPELDFQPRAATCASTDVDKTGTSIFISDLQSDWSREKIQRIANSDLAKLADPFAKARANKFMEVVYQGTSISVPTLDPEPLGHADAIVEATFRYEANGAPKLAVHINYLTHKKERTLHIEGDHLRACVREEMGTKKNAKPKFQVDGEIVARALEHLGPWDLKFYWFNRGRIQRNQREIYDTQVKGFLEQWAGGFLVYRDGYRVYPYGERKDDWLDLDRKALASSAYKLNRAQIVGYLRFSSIANPMLLDQTNREGFRDSTDKEALRRLLRCITAGFVRQFLEEVDRDVEQPIEEVKLLVSERISTSKGLAIESLKRIQSGAPSESKNVATVMHHLEEVSDAWERAKLRIESFDKEIEGFIHLAGVGLMLEFIAHELARVTQDTLRAVVSGKMSPQAVEAQLKTLEKRLRILDELSIPGRQIRQQNSILEIAQLLVDFHQSKAARMGIQLTIAPLFEKSPWQERVEKGQVLQILDNLLSNAFYWLDNRLDRSVTGTIHVELDKSRREVRVTDNGPGIPDERAEAIFEKFMTTKPPREGRGLGLYIARRLAEENDATLELAPADSDGMARTFVLAFGKKTD